MPVSRKSHKERVERITGRKVYLAEGKISVSEKWIMVNGRKTKFKKSSERIVENLFAVISKGWMTPYEASAKTIISIGCAMKYLAIMYDEGLAEKRLKENGAFEYTAKGGSRDEKKTGSVVGCVMEPHHRV